MSGRDRALWCEDELEEVVCDACGSDGRLITVRPDGLRAVECTRCELCFLSPRPRPHVISRLYGRDYYQNPVQSNPSAYVDYAGEANRLWLEAEAARRVNLLRTLRRLVGRRVLELGCATGEVATLLVRAGARVVATDISDWAIGEARLRHPQVEFRHGGWTCLGEREQFDIVVAFEVIEHVLHPSQFFERASVHVAPGGMLVLSTPNRACAGRLTPDRWLGFNVSFEHLYFFTAATLAGYAERNGFREGPWFTGGGKGQLRDEASPVKTRLAVRVPGRWALRRLRHELRARTFLPLHGYSRSDAMQHQLVATFNRVRER